MPVSRRTLLRSAGAVALGVPLAACGPAAVPGALALLRTIGNKLVEGFGMALGEDIALGARELVVTAASRLPRDKGDQVGDTVLAAASTIVDATNTKAAAAANFRHGDELTSYAVHLNAEGHIVIPTIFTFALTLLAREGLDAAEQEAARTGRQPDWPTVRADIRERLSINYCERTDGSDRLDQYGRFRALTFRRRNIEVEWDPTTSRTKQCRLVIRNGTDLQGAAPRWEAERTIPIPSHLVFDPPSA